MLHPVSSGSSSQDCNSKLFDSTAVKVSLVVIGLLLVGGALATHFLHVNAIATFTLAGCGGLAILSTILMMLVRCRTKIPEQNVPVDAPSPAVATLIMINDRDSQLRRYQELPMGNESGLFTGSYKYCDHYANGFPSNAARVTLGEDTPTNGAFVWDRALIMIQGPHNFLHMEHMWRIAAEHNVGAIVRLGPIYRYMSYTPDIPFEFEKIRVSKGPNPTEDKFQLTTRTDYSLQFDGIERDLPIYAIEGWEDFGTNQIEEVYCLILELGSLGVPIMIHCRGGLGRTGTFAACWKIYQLFKEAKAQGLQSLEVDPVAIVEEMRQARCSTVQTDEQFNMILGFVDYLNSLETRSDDPLV